MKDIIAISGYSGSGKARATQIALSLFPQAVQLNFGSHLKDILSQSFEIDLLYFNLSQVKDRDFEDPIYLTAEMLDKTLRLYGIEAEYHDFKKFIGKMIYTPRELMEFMGTEVLRSFDPEIHITTAFRVAPKADQYIIGDLRFLVELEYLRANSKTLQVLHVDNEQANNAAAKRKSIAEREISKISKIALHVDNNGTEESFRYNIEKFIKI